MDQPIKSVHKVDTSEWKRTMREYLKDTSVELSRAINIQARELAYEAIVQTPKADLKKIRAQLLGPARNSVSARDVTRGGRQRKSRMRNKAKDTLAARIYLKRVHEGKAVPAYGKDLSKAAREIYNDRVRGIGYMKSGWVPVHQYFKNKTVGKGGKGGGKSTPKVDTFGRDKGAGSAAKPTKLSARLINEALADITKNSVLPGIAFRLGKAAIKRAISVRIDDMRRRMAKRMEDQAKKFSSRKR